VERTRYPHPLHQIRMAVIASTTATMCRHREGLAYKLDHLLVNPVHRPQDLLETMVYTFVQPKTSCSCCSKVLLACLSVSSALSFATACLLVLTAPVLRPPLRQGLVRRLSRPKHLCVWSSSARTRQLDSSQQRHTAQDTCQLDSSQQPELVSSNSDT
jgi:hypothetical protein